MRDPHNHQSRGFGFITFQRDDSAKQVLQNRYHDMLGKRVEVKSAVPRGQAPPPQRGPPRSSQGYGYGQPRGGAGHTGAGGGYGYGVQSYSGSSNPWGMNSGFGDPNSTGVVGQNLHAGPAKTNYGYNKDAGGAPRQDQSAGGSPGTPAHGWTEHTAPEGKCGVVLPFCAPVAAFCATFSSNRPASVPSPLVSKPETVSPFLHCIFSIFFTPNASALSICNVSELTTKEHPGMLFP